MGLQQLQTKINNMKTKMKIIEEANNFLLRMHLASPRHYQTPIQLCIITPYTTYTKKYMMIGTNPQRQSDMKLTKPHKGV